MDIKELKKILAGLGVASLVSGAGLGLVTSAATLSGSGQGAGGADPQMKESGQTGESGNLQGAGAQQEKDKNRQNGSKQDPGKAVKKKTPGKSG